MQINLRDLQADDFKGTIDISDTTFAQPFKEALIHQVVTAYLAKARAGTHAQKNRSAVSGGGRKPWKQKGTGNARAGTTRSPIWRKGGVAFAASTRDYSHKVNKKMYRAAMRSILSELVRQERMLVVDAVTLPEPKTKLLAKQLESLGLANVLIVIDSFDRNLELAVRNLPNVDVCNVENIDPVNLIDCNKLMITVSALKKLEGCLE